MTINVQSPLDSMQSERLLLFCLKQGVDAFTAVLMSATPHERQWMDEVADHLVPFTLGIHTRERPVTRANQSHFVLTECWAFNAQTLRLILQACGGSIGEYQMGHSPEDWAFYRRGELFLAVDSHGGQIFIRLGDDEIEQFKLLGLMFIQRD